MKNTVVILFILFLLTSCGSTKRTVNDSQTDTTEVVLVKETPATPETQNTTSTEPVEPSVIAETPTPIESQTTKEEEEEEVIETTTKTGFNHSAWNTLLQHYVTNTGNVNYKGLKSNRKALTNYIHTLGDNMPNNTWSKAEKIAYWINAYNAMTVDLIIRNYPIESIKDINNPWEQRLWKLGNKWYNLDEIEHQILRKMDEPRIHFGIVCASFSCPKLLNEAFTASRLENQLTRATKEFLKDPKRNNISANAIKLSKIFKWFAKDFKTEGSLIDFLNKYSDITISKNAKKSFKDYNWSLNN
ncbi:DUF547 domain-containing protein [Pontimicrobium sp. MEBiC06410]